MLLLALGAGLGACSQQEADQAAAADVTAPPAEVATAPVPAGHTTDEGGSSVYTTQDSEDIIITGNNSVQTRTVNGQDIQVLGDGNQATFTGRGKDFYAVGNANTVVLEHVKSIQVTGDNNVVTWKGDTPNIQNAGKNNTISQVK